METMQDLHGRIYFFLPEDSASKGGVFLFRGTRNLIEARQRFDFDFDHSSLTRPLRVA